MEKIHLAASLMREEDSDLRFDFKSRLVAALALIPAFLSLVLSVLFDLSRVGLALLQLTLPDWGP